MAGEERKGRLGTDSLRPAGADRRCVLWMVTDALGFAGQERRRLVCKGELL